MTLMHHKIIHDTTTATIAKMISWVRFAPWAMACVLTSRDQAAINLTETVQIKPAYPNDHSVLNVHFFFPSC